MHGRPRDYKHKLRDPKAQEAYKKKVDAIRQGTALVLECRRQRRYDELVMNASAKLLKVVPEIYTIWNFRREALSEAFAAGGAAAQAASDGELALTQACLMENPKSYSTWHHRKWVVLKGLADLDKELLLVSSALDEDQRNFHAWHYRQFLARLMGRPVEAELEYSVDKVVQNFSNYSAWHYRTILLPRMHCGGGDGGAGGAQQQQQQQQEQPGVMSSATLTPPPSGPSAPQGPAGSASQTRPLPHDVLDEEYDMVHQAFATDSKDQSPWMYYRWLVGNTLAHLSQQPASTSGSGQDEDASRERVCAVLAREISRLREDHLAEDPDAKWPLLNLARLLEAQARLGLGGDGSLGLTGHHHQQQQGPAAPPPTPPSGDITSPSGHTAAGAALDVDSSHAGPDAGSMPEEVRSIYCRLMVLDPMRRGYYQDALDGKALSVVQALGSVVH